MRTLNPNGRTWWLLWPPLVAMPLLVACANDGAPSPTPSPTPAEYTLTVEIEGLLHGPFGLVVTTSAIDPFGR
jgi:hypothetical protein